MPPGKPNPQDPSLNALKAPEDPTKRPLLPPSYTLSTLLKTPLFTLSRPALPHSFQEEPSYCGNSTHGEHARKRRR
eukprot:6460714-Amphidinium_carterae.1